ncbi:Phage transcriptional regulator [Streptococcus pneumoniae]|nr:Phage transcriptional regulator [Streptococcus pneumoniae]
MNRIKQLRKENNLTQRELANETKIPYRTIQRWENGETDIKSDAAQVLADYFGVSIPHLLGYSDLIADTDSDIKAMAYSHLLTFVDEKQIKEFEKEFIRANDNSDTFGDLGSGEKALEKYYQALCHLVPPFRDILARYSFLSLDEKKSVYNIIVGLSNNLSKENK